jgi:predicted transcriptional regulator
VSEPKKRRTAKWRSTDRKKTKLPPRPKTAKKGVTIEALERALRKAGGLYADAARLLGLSRQTVRDRVEGSARLKAVVAEAREELLDIAESKLVSAIKKGNLGAICFFLRTQGRNRGYVERNEIEPASIEKMQFYLPKKAELPAKAPPVAEYDDRAGTDEPPPKG